VSVSVTGKACEKQLEVPSSGLRIQARKLTKRYERRTVLRDFDIEIPAGEAVVLFGPNGAGKTTLLRVLSTLTRPQRGSLSINGHDSEADAIVVRGQIGVLAHQPYVYDSLTARENLQFFGRMFEVENAEARIDEVLQAVELIERADDQVGTFSRGMLQRIALARAILHAPSILLFDEPDTGLDPASVRVLERILAEHCQGGGSLLMTTHDLAFGIRVADRVLIMTNGQISVDRSSDQIDTAEVEAHMGAPGA
jgi:heme ABC exporter ATP-binding subunit CcmA